METPGTPPSEVVLTTSELEILKLRMKYAWDWWEFHGRQRMNMFNYFLVVTGILVNGCLTALKDATIRDGALTDICLLGVFQSISFFMIDVRNRKMLYYANDLLRCLESKYLIGDPCPGLTVRAEEEGRNWWLSKTKMVYWIRGTYLLVALGFMLVLTQFCLARH